MNASLLEDLISESLRGSFDRILIRLLEEKEQIKLKPAQEVGRALNYSPDSIRTLISRGKFIAVKRGKEWFTHEKLLLRKMGQMKEAYPHSRDVVNSFTYLLF